jgi:hypothetical protein
MKHSARMLYVVLLCMSLSGCARKFNRWTHGVWYQGVAIPSDIQMPRDCVRSVTVYDQFTTCARFDVLWLSYDMRMAYVKLHSFRKGLSVEEQAALCAQAREEDRLQIVFYILTTLATPFDDQAQWEVTLHLDNGVILKPSTIAPVTIEPEYKAAFGICYNSFKIAYKCIFKKYDAQGIVLWNQDDVPVQLHFAGLGKQFFLSWNMQRNNERNNRCYRY